MINKKIKAAYFIVTVFLTLGLSMSLQNLLAVWESPTENPPAGDVEAPINVGVDPQAKLGNLSLAGNLFVGDGVVDAMLVESTTGNVTVAGRIKASDPQENDDVATRGWVEAQGVGGGGEVVDPDRPGVGSASAGFDNHGGNFVGLSTATHNGNFSGKRAADNWCKANVANSDHMCNSWELHGVGAGAGNFYYQITRKGDSSFLTKEGLQINLREIWNREQSSGYYWYDYRSVGDWQTYNTYYAPWQYHKYPGLDCYKIRRDGGLIHTINSGGTTNYDTSVPAYDTLYEFRVTPINPDGSESTASTSNTITLTCTEDPNNIGSPDGEDNDCDTVVDDTRTRQKTHNTPYFAVNTIYTCPDNPFGGLYDNVSWTGADLHYHIDTTNVSAHGCTGSDANYCQAQKLTEPKSAEVPNSTTLWWSANCGSETWILDQGCRSKLDGTVYYSYGEALAHCEYNVTIYDDNGGTRQ